jgi:hypothetical protein
LRATERNVTGGTLRSTGGRGAGVAFLRTLERGLGRRRGWLGSGLGKLTSTESSSRCSCAALAACATLPCFSAHAATKAFVAASSAPGVLTANSSGLSRGMVARYSLSSGQRQNTTERRPFHTSGSSPLPRLVVSVTGTLRSSTCGLARYSGIRSGASRGSRSISASATSSSSVARLGPRHLSVRRGSITSYTSRCPTVTSTGIASSTISPPPSHAAKGRARGPSASSSMRARISRRYTRDSRASVASVSSAP